MQILHLSDTHNSHNQLKNLPFAEIIIHSGDFSFEGTEKETLDFITWFYALPYKYKIFIAGNHDDHLYGHIHESYGSSENKYTLFSNASTTDVDYRIKNRGFLIDF